MSLFPEGKVLKTNQICNSTPVVSTSISVSISSVSIGMVSIGISIPISVVSISISISTTLAKSLRRPGYKGGSGTGMSSNTQTIGTDTIAIGIGTEAIGQVSWLSISTALANIATAAIAGGGGVRGRDSWPVRVGIVKSRDPIHVARVSLRTHGGKHEGGNQKLRHVGYRTLPTEVQSCSDAGYAVLRPFIQAGPGNPPIRSQ